MRLAVVSFSDTGEALAKRIADGLEGREAPARHEEKASLCEVWTARCPRDGSLAAWTKVRFADADGLVFIGAAGIAVRAIAPYVQSKATDPAVVVVDEGGCYAVSLLSGHLGGGNALTMMIAEAADAEPVITTATDVHGQFAVDDWARTQALTVFNKQMIKEVSAAVLKGREVPVITRQPIGGTEPAGIREVREDPRPERSDDPAVALSVSMTGPAAKPHTLVLIPHALCLGIGCRKGTSKDRIEEAWQAFRQKNHIFEEAVCEAATIDLKKDEPGLLAFCEAHGWPLRTYTAEQLLEAPAIPGGYTPSAFVEKTTGVANVCERCAVFMAAEKGDEEQTPGEARLLVRKTAHDGVTFAAAVWPMWVKWPKNETTGEQK